MLVREEDGGALLCIGQASHAWVSGQLARAWRPAVPEAVCLAAEQHDVGMSAWDLSPALDLDTGGPVPFTKMDRREHIGLWREAPLKLLSQSAYAALLVSLHGTHLYERYPGAPEHAALVASYLADERAFQARLRESLGVAADDVARFQQLVAAWDGMSLCVCLGWESYSAVDVTLTRTGSWSFVVDPWPFVGDGPLDVVCEGRLLYDRGSRDAPALRLALEAAARVDVVVTLVRAAGGDRT